MARFKANEGQGHPVIHGRTIAPGKGGIYEVGDPVAIEHMRAHGYRDLDAAPAEKAPAPSSAPSVPQAQHDELRGAVADALGKVGVAVPKDAPHGVLLQAIGGISAHVDGLVKAAEERVLKELADKGDGKKLV